MRQSSVPAWDSAARVLLLIGGGVLLVGSSIVGFGSFEPSLELLARAPLVLAGLMGFWVGLEIREPRSARTPLTPRRHGDSWAAEDSLRRSPQTHTATPAGAPSVAIGLDRRNTMVAFATGTVLAVIGWTVASSEASRGEFTEQGALGLIAFAFGAGLALRSALRAVTASRAVTVDRDGITLGVALGYVSPRRLRFDEIAEVVDITGEALQLIVVTTAGRAFTINGRHVPDAAGTTTGRLTQWRPDIAVTRIKATARGEAETEAERLTALPVMSGDEGPSPDVVSRAASVLRRRAVITWAVAVVGAVGLVVVWWYASLRSLNDDVVANGVRTIATVVDVERGRGPDSIVVEGTYRDVAFAGTIDFRWWQGFDRGLRGQRIQVLVDPDQPDFVRLPEQRNYPTGVWLALLGAGVVLGIGFPVAVLRTRQARRIGAARWMRAVIWAIPGWRSTSGSVALEGDTESRSMVGVAGLAGRRFEAAPAWLNVHGKHLVIVTDDGGSVLTAAMSPADWRA